ncbi:hypothetical protein HWV62_25991 [Athelia sp. TMB]|nr:hypothetical protein HWV62_25991 [Athelia sp. TMB]
MERSSRRGQDSNAALCAISALAAQETGHLWLDRRSALRYERERGAACIANPDFNNRASGSPFKGGSEGEEVAQENGKWLPKQLLLDTLNAIFAFQSKRGTSQSMILARSRRFQAKNLPSNVESWFQSSESQASSFHLDQTQATVHLVSSGKDKSSALKVKDIVVKADTLKFSVQDSKHDFLYKTLKLLATGLVKKQIQKAIRDAITTGMELVGIRDRYAAAKATEGASRAQVLQDTFAQKKDDAPTTASQAQAKASQFKVVHNKRNSILSNSGRPPDG